MRLKVITSESLSLQNAIARVCLDVDGELQIGWKRKGGISYKVFESKSGRVACTVWQLMTFDESETNVRKETL